MTLRCPIILLVFLVAPMARSQEPAGAPPELNRSFQDPDVQSFVDRFESESREVATLRDEVLKVLGLRPGMEVADIGAGTGLYTIPMAGAVGPQGAVYAVDIAPNFLKFIAGRASEAGLVNVCTVLGTQDSPQLPPGSVDLVFMCDTYHHFENPPAMLEAIRRALRPGGQLVVIDFDRREGESSEFIMEHVRADKETFFKEITDAGFRRRSLEGVTLPEFEENFFAMFVREPGPGEPRAVPQPAPAQPEQAARDRDGAVR